MEYLCQANRDDAVEFIGEVIASHHWYRAIRINEHRIGSMPDQCLELGKMNGGGEEIEYACAANRGCEVGRVMCV